MLNKKNKTVLFSILAILALAFFLRSAGLFRGLDAGYVYHPDEPKQVVALSNYLQGHYIWYIGSSFYDGYPYGLNHIDEWILRPVFELRSLIHEHISPDIEYQGDDINSLYYWARALRVFYGMVALVLAGFVAQKLFKSTKASMLAMFLLALAPLSIAVAHFATGDIGLDLFTSAMLAFLCLYALKSRKVYLFLAALFLGIAFACKYNGLLAGAAIGMCLLLELVSGEKSFKETLINAGTTLVGVLIGAIAATPAFLFDWKRTWKDIRINFEFIKNYGVDESFLAKPLHERIMLSFHQNFPVVMQSVGWTLLFAGLAGTFVAAIQLYRVMRSNKTENGNLSIRILRLSIFVCPFIAFLIAFAGKPATQPFHFSYLQIPLTLSAVFFLYWVWSMSKTAARAAAIGLFLIILLELGLQTVHENFFWRRDDNMRVVKDMPKQIFDSKAPVKNPGTIKSVSLEPDSNPAVFRNRHRFVIGNRAGFWESLQIAPVPSIPYPAQNDWIFMNGPIFPRNDRMIAVAGNSSVSKVLVFENDPGKVSLGIRSGNLPVQASINLGGVSKTAILPPNTQRIIEITPKRWRESAMNKQIDNNLSLVKASIEASLGDVVLNFMTNEREIEYFKIFGGEPLGIEPKFIPSIDNDEIENALEEINFMKGDLSFTLDQERPGLLIPQRQLARLPAGVYNVDIEVTGIADQTELSFDLTDPLNLNGVDESSKVLFGKGRQNIQYIFQKTFAPYMSQLRIMLLQGECELVAYSITPAFPEIMSDLNKWSESGIEPIWRQKTQGESDFVDALSDKKIKLGNRVDVIELAFPEKINIGDELFMRCSMEISNFPFRDFKNYSVFVHFIDGKGRQIHATDCPLWMATASHNNKALISLGDLPNIPLGTHELKIGIYNGRTHKRLSISGEIDANSRSERRASLGHIQVEE
jgi:hypothetical protein